jgi:hypothetical protein
MRAATGLIGREQHRMGMAERPLEPIAARLRACHQRSMNQYRTRATATV